MTTLTQTTTTIQNFTKPEFSWWLNVWLPLIISIIAGFITGRFAGKISGNIVLKGVEPKVNTTPEDILAYIDTLRNRSDDMKEADKQTLLDCYHGYKEQAERVARGEQSEGVHSMKTLLPCERRLIVTLYNAIRNKSFMGRSFVLLPLDEAKRQSYGNIDYWDFICAIVSEELGIATTPTNQQTKEKSNEQSE